MSTSTPTERTLPLSATDYHVLLVLAEEDLYGYGIMKAIERDSSGAFSPEIGSLYRILARLMTSAYVVEVAPPAGSSSDHRGRPRRYYKLTKEGRVALHNESLRLQAVLEVARERQLLTEA